MKKKLRKSITIFVCMALLTLFIPQSTVSALGPNERLRVNDIYYQMNADGKTLRIEWYSGDVTSLETLVIPSSVTDPSDGKTYPVTKIGHVVSGKPGTVALKSVHIPQGIVEIEDGAFSECTNLNTLTFDPDMTSLTKIGPRAFRNAPLNTALVRIPYGVTSIGVTAFTDSIPQEFILPDTLTYIGDLSEFLMLGKTDVWLEVRKDVEIIGPGLGIPVATEDSVGGTLKISGVELQYGGKVTNNGDVPLPVRLPEGNEITVNPGESYALPSKEADVKLTYAPGIDGGTVYSVDILWGNMEFTYNEGGPGKWNRLTHTYDGATEQGWSVNTTGGDMVTVDNHSNTGIEAGFAYNSNRGYDIITGTLSGDGITAGKATLSSAENTAPQNPPSVTAKLTLAGALPASMPAAQTVIGTVTVTIEKP